MGDLSAEVEVIVIESDDDDLEVTAYLGAGTTLSMYHVNLRTRARHIAH